MKIQLELTEKDLRRLVLYEIRRKTGIDSLEEKDVSIETKSKQNYRSEWEAFELSIVGEGLGKVGG